MPEKNKDFVAYMPSLDCQWIFTKEMEAETIAETYDEVLSLCHDVFYASRNFLIPTTARFTLHAFDSDTDASRIFQVDPIDIETGEISHEEGLKFDQLERRIDESALGLNSPVSIFEIEITSATTVIALGQQAVAVNSGTGELYKWMYHGEPTDRRPSFDPVTVGIYRRKGVELAKPIYKIVVTTHTDIWFEETQTGEQNLRRLAEVLSELDERLDPSEVDFHSERYLSFQSSIMPDNFLADEFLDS